MSSCNFLIAESSLSKFLSKTKSMEKTQQWLEQLRAVFVLVMTSQPNTLRGGIIAEVLEKAVAVQDRVAREKVFKKKQSHGM